MNHLLALAEFLQAPSLADLPPARHELLKLHVADSIGAMLAGFRLEEGAAIKCVVADGGPAVAALCAATRSTEMDDIHLASCTTPGSVIVPTALALAAAGDLRQWRDFAAAAVAGYETLIRVGCAIDGPAVLLKKVWPTGFAAAAGSAAAAARAYGLNVEQTAGAVATALVLSTGTAAPARTPSASRWLALGAAAANGVLAARGARRGLVGSSDLLDRYSGRIAGIRISRGKLVDGLGQRYRFDEIGCKPYPIARQGLAAVEAARQLVAAEGLEACSIEQIVAELPEQQRAIVDHPEPPVTRMEAIVSLQSQIALALQAPELLARVRVHRAPDLERHYPDAWPARVEIKAGGKLVRQEVIYPKGDHRNPFDWEDLVRKFPAEQRVFEQIRNLSAADATPPLWELCA